MPGKMNLAPFYARTRQRRLEARVQAGIVQKIVSGGQSGVDRAGGWRARSQNAALVVSWQTGALPQCLGQ